MQITDAHFSPTGAESAGNLNLVSKGAKYFPTTYHAVRILILSLVTKLCPLSMEFGRIRYSSVLQKN